MVIHQSGIKFFRSNQIQRIENCHNYERHLIWSDCSRTGLVFTVEVLELALEGAGEAYIVASEEGFELSSLC